MIFNFKDTKFSYILVYLFTILICLSRLDIIQIWVGLELNTISFILLICNRQEFKIKNIHSSCILYYFLIQRLSSIGILFSFFIESSQFYLIDNFPLLIISSLFLKIGLVPLFFWVFRLSLSISYPILGVLLSIQKLAPAVILFSMNSNLILILLFNSLVRCFFLLFRKSTLDLIIFSRIYTLIWMYLLFCGSLIMFLSFYSIYRFLILSLFLSNSFNSLDESENSDKSNMLIILFILGLPPLPFFFFKIFRVSELLYLCSNQLLSISIWIIVFFSVLGYINFFYYKIFIWEKTLYKISNKMRLYLNISFLLIFLFFLTF